MSAQRGKSGEARPAVSGELIPDELVEVAARLLACGEIAGEWEPEAPWSERWRKHARAVLSALLKAGWVLRGSEIAAQVAVCRNFLDEIANAEPESEDRGYAAVDLLFAAYDLERLIDEASEASA